MLVFYHYPITLTIKTNESSNEPYYFNELLEHIKNKSTHERNKD